MKKVAVWGKFDCLHEGHLQFLKHAKELGDELYVVIISDEKIKENSGKLPVNKAEKRKEELIKLDLVKEVYIDSIDKGLESIIKLKPDVFAFGHDQKTKWESKLKDYLSSKGLNLKYVYLGIYNNGIHNSDIH